ncbi:MAG: quinone oxidoreductase [Gammaproteobacteria bacterium]|nr:quinone oxidoreductase [Gammaproteobacteria bacterium]
MRLIQIDRCGGPEVLQWREAPAPVAGPGQVLLRQTAVGLNYIDTYHRSGLYPIGFPAGLGLEAAGVVTAVGAGVAGLQAGDRATYCSPPPGAYATERVMPAEKIVKLPDQVSDQAAAASMLKGLTAWYLLRRSYPVRPGDTVLSYAAAGGVGLLLSQWARHLGVRVIGVAGSEEKAALARANGCAEVVLADDPQFVARVRALSGGGVAAAYDSVGCATFIQSLDCLRRHGVMVSYGNASGPVEPFSPLELSKRGSLYITRPSLFDFIGTREELLAGTGELFDLIARGVLHVHVGQTFPLAAAADAHRALESRRTTGSTLLLP